MHPDPERPATEARARSDALRDTPLLPPDGHTPVPEGLAPTQGAGSPEVGTTLGPYRLVAWLGVGSAAVVFRAAHVLLNISAAVKVPHREHPAGRRATHAHLRNEARVLARVSHPHLAGLWDFKDDPEYPYLVTEYVPGPTLGEVLRKRGPLGARPALRVVAQAAEALGALWDAGVVHRDVKPDNLILSPGGVVKLIDLGSAKLVADDAPPAPLSATAPAYAAPELARGKSPGDLRADIYSLGVTFYEAVTGRLPFAGPSAEQVILRHREEAPLPPSEARPGVSRAVSDVILRMMAKNPAVRFQSAAELRAALQSLR